MRFSSFLIYTLREDPKDAEIVSHKLMLRAGLIYKEESGLYCYLPLGFRVYNKVVNIVREEMNRFGGVEALPTILTPGGIWEESGRLHTMGKEMIRIKDRRDGLLVLGPTHEEAFTDIVRRTISSYKQLPITLYQIAKKFRDEIRPRFGVMRCREFTMKDAYSFDIDEEGLEKSYLNMRQAYISIFKRVGLNALPVEADVGSMGGTRSEEFMVFSSVGEAVILYCPKCGYYANVERAESVIDETPDDEEEKPIREVDTPNVYTINDLTSFFKTQPRKFIKSLIYKSDGEPIMVLIRGDLDVNEVKLKNYLNAVELELADPETVESITKAPVGFAGPVGLNRIRIIADNSVKTIKNGITGANKKDKHLINVNINRDFVVSDFANIRSAKSGDGCPRCNSILEETRGIEVGHIFKLGYKYTESMDVSVLDKNGNRIRPIMGCYGIGIDRTIAAVIEVSNDENGIIFPITIAPFEVIVIPISNRDEKIVKVAQEIYKGLLSKGVDVAIDDREETAGVKFNDADLIGIPFKVIVGKKTLNENKVEVKRRDNGQSYEFDLSGAVEDVKRLVDEEHKKYNTIEV
ncbi:MAG: proline--tRNA ligase [Spirochaetia bacterium]|nr:proline--tRNA ligase [Spirochaetota bacterium]MCX8097284.1 proline--tRNA ligase [Spirochaetota bacterium]MDW8112577.1 proline--tRNA ligase [Spirochaetia bacterium]